MATAEEYYAANPVEAIDRNRWEWYDPMVATMFRGNAFYTPLMGYIDLRSPVNNITDTEIIRGHVNPSAIGLRTLYVDPMTFSSRRREFAGYQRYGQKVQWHKLDPLLNMWRMGGASEKQLLAAVLRDQLAYSMFVTTEFLARNQYLKNGNHKFYGPFGQYSDFSGIKRDPADMFSVNALTDIRLRLGVRANFTARFGTYRSPVPGKPDQILISTTPGVVHDIWTHKDEFMVSLRELQDQRLLHGGAIEWHNFTVQEVPWDASLLWNAGLVDKQVAVLKYTVAGDGVSADRGIIGGVDGAPDPDTSEVFNMYKVGSASEAVHYVQCSPFDPGDFAVGDFVSLHSVRYTSAGTLGDNWWGINQGCAFLDGDTQVLEIAEVDAANDRLAFATPVMSDYDTQLYASGADVPLAQPDNTPTDWTATRDVIAFITKAQHIHPVLIAASAGAHAFSIMQKMTIHTPPAYDDFESIQRISWDMVGATHAMNPDIYELYFVAGSFGNRGAVGM